jgi:hypothetical protein
MFKAFGSLIYDIKDFTNSAEHGGGSGKIICVAPMKEERVFNLAEKNQSLSPHKMSSSSEDEITLVGKGKTATAGNDLQKTNGSNAKILIKAQ